MQVEEPSVSADERKKKRAAQRSREGATIDPQAQRTQPVPLDTIAKTRRSRNAPKNDTDANKTASAPTPNIDPLLARLNPAVARSNRPVAAVPQPRPVALLSSEKALLSAELAVDSADLCASSQTIQSYARPAAPGLNDAEQYEQYEQSAAGTFRSSAERAPPLLLSADDAAFVQLDNPVGSTQATMGVLGFCFYAAQGVVAGGSAVQLAVMPSHFGTTELSLHLAYAPIAVPWQSTMRLMSALAFLGACETCCFAPAHARQRAGAALLLYGAVVFLLALETPLDVSLAVGASSRSAGLAAALLNAGDDPTRFIYPRYNSSIIDVPMGLENSTASDLTGMTLSIGSLSLWWWLGLLRAVCALLAWFMMAVGMSSPQYAVPPVSEGGLGVSAMGVGSAYDSASGVGGRATSPPPAMIASTVAYLALAPSTAMMQPKPVTPTARALAHPAMKQDFLEASPYYDQSTIPVNTYKAKTPFIAKVTSCKRIVGPEATGETCHIIMDHEGKMPYWEGQSYGVIPPGENPKKPGKPNTVRLYSIASSRYGDDMTGKTTSLCVRRATYWCPELKADDPAKKGICSNFLCDSKPGQELTLTGPSGKVMLIPESNPNADLIMVATGTGIAPYRSFIRRLFVEETPYGEVYKGLAWLFLGVANSDALLYDDEWQSVLKSHPDNFKVDYALSREQTNKDGGKMYIQDKVAEYADEIFTRMDNGAHMYFCGLKGMMPGITQMLEKVSTDKGLVWEEKLGEWKKAGQWHVEVY